MEITRVHHLIALLGAGVLTTACQSNQRPAPMLPARQANAPAMTMSAVPKVAVEVPTPVQVAQPEPKPDPVEELISRVESEYLLGQQNYQAGHLEAAKENFDKAFDLLLGSPLEIRSDDRLQKEFDRVLDGVNGLELQALQEGDGFTEQKSEPAPIDEANETTVPVDPNIKATAEAEVK